MIHTVLVLEDGKSFALARIYIMYINIAEFYFISYMNVGKFAFEFQDKMHVQNRSNYFAIQISTGEQFQGGRATMLLPETCGGEPSDTWGAAYDTCKDLSPS